MFLRQARDHRRRIALEEKAKVVTSDWGTESLLCQLFCLGLFETNGKDSVPNPTTFALSSSSILLLWCASIYLQYVYKLLNDEHTFVQQIYCTVRHKVCPTFVKQKFLCTGNVLTCEGTGSPYQEIIVIVQQGAWLDEVWSPAPRPCLTIA